VARLAARRVWEIFLGMARLYQVSRRPPIRAHPYLRLAESAKVRHAW